MKMRKGAFIRDVPGGSVRWYKEAGWKPIKKGRPKKDDTENKAAASSEL